jgi:hypothetical protein
MFVFFVIFKGIQQISWYLCPSSGNKKTSKYQHKHFEFISKHDRSSVCKNKIVSHPFCRESIWSQLTLNTSSTSQNWRGQIQIWSGCLGKQRDK